MTQEDRPPVQKPAAAAAPGSTAATASVAVLRVKGLGFGV